MKRILIGIIGLPTITAGAHCSQVVTFDQWKEPEPAPSMEDLVLCAKQRQYQPESAPGRYQPWRDGDPFKGKGRRIVRK